MLKPYLQKQMSLFDAEQVKPILTVVDYPEDLAFLYTASECGNNSGIRFMMSLEDAMTWCSLDISKGQLHGTNWAYFFTSVKNFISCYWGTQRPVIDLTHCVDNGSWDERIAKAGCTKFSFYEIRKILKEYGIDVLVPIENRPVGISDTL